MLEVKVNRFLGVNINTWQEQGSNLVDFVSIM